MGFNKKAIIIENSSQLARFRKMIKGYGIYVSPIPVEPLFYIMLLETNCGVFAIPNTSLTGTETSVLENGFLPMTINQFSEYLKSLK